MYTKWTHTCTYVFIVGRLYMYDFPQWIDLLQWNVYLKKIKINKYLPASANKGEHYDWM